MNKSNPEYIRVREEIAKNLCKLSRIKTCVACSYWKTCERTQPDNYFRQDYPEMLCEAEVDRIVFHIMKVIEREV
jgi:hypothetical protein